MKELAPVTVIHGPAPNTEAFDSLAGKNVTTVREGLKEAFNISDDATATVNGLPVQDACVLQQGDCLEFHNPAR